MKSTEKSNQSFAFINPHTSANEGYLRSHAGSLLRPLDGCCAIVMPLLDGPIFVNVAATQHSQRLGKAGLTQSLSSHTVPQM